ncbi:MAG: tRNA (N6-threonylcarbamoyladenosine(37)-N6)-methyltransferase TrmO [Ruminococcaceae bacterium]|nr:tRNA (N6-threonylcarbamoyladenosine(37)-N6)-methyltransferase TrmO [Oscillospiraceae bacterium]
MNNKHTFENIAKIKTEFPTKFGIPRQSGLIPTLKGKIVFEPKYRNPEALRGIEGYSHLWLIWNFSESESKEWSATVRPPRLGGNKRVGVFATRSPYRPNPIGLSSVKFEGLCNEKDGSVSILVSGADLLDGTPIYDIKPYIPYTDSHPEAVGGFAEGVFGNKLTVVYENGCETIFSGDDKLSLDEILASDPRPAYQDDAERIYSFEFSEYKIKFKVEEKNLKVFEIQKAE